MAKKKTESAAGKCCSADLAAASSCRVDSLVSVDERGQMVLPKALRDKAGIKTGDKLGVVVWEKNGKVCCITLLKAEEMAEMAQSVLSPILKGVV
jgi:antitoxin PrlF